NHPARQLFENESEALDELLCVLLTLGDEDHAEAREEKQSPSSISQGKPGKPKLAGFQDDHKALGEKRPQCLDLRRPHGEGNDDTAPGGGRVLVLNADVARDKKSAALTAFVDELPPPPLPADHFHVLFAELDCHLIDVLLCVKLR